MHNILSCCCCYYAVTATTAATAAAAAAAAADDDDDASLRTTGVDIQRLRHRDAHSLDVKTDC
eukprot:4919-Heterococcus_DN1.PRE.2